MKRILTLTALCLAALACGKKQAPELYTIKNASGMEVSITNYGGRIVSLLVPDRDGNLKDVVLGFYDLEDYYPERNETDFGASIGRYANRIKDGRITIDGKEYQLPQNNFGHCLHGGTRGWQYQFYNAVEVTENSLKLERISPDGDQNFPGNVKAYVTFTLTDGNALDIQYEATTDAPTVINMTNHAYFNLSGDPANHSICDDELYINASAFTPVDDTFMTTGEIWPVEGTPMDFRTPKLIGQDIDADYEQLRNGHGYDHNWVLDSACDDTVVAAELYCPATGIDLKVYTDEPGIQVYAGNFLDGTVTGKGGVVYQRRTAICLETQKYPDTPNKPEWPSALLRPGETYTSHCVFEFGIK
ncbi:MAG: galactose mutarotase [Bacteroidales bacterium]|nr:galactose mutarotase [Bacteroidales bacterium]